VQRKTVKGAFPFVSKRKSLSLAEGEKIQEVCPLLFFRRLDSKADLSAPGVLFETTPRELGHPDFSFFLSFFKDAF
jgi:hypothetical protein